MRRNPVLGPNWAVLETAVLCGSDTSLSEKFPAVRIVNQIQAVCKYIFINLRSKKEDQCATNALLLYKT